MAVHPAPLGPSPRSQTRRETGGERDGGGERQAGKGDGQARRQRRGGYCGGGGEVRQGGAKSAPGPSRLGVLPAPPLSLQSSE